MFLVLTTRVARIEGLYGARPLRFVGFPILLNAAIAGILL